LHKGWLTVKTRPARSEVPLEQTWDLTPLYPTIASWEADIAIVEAETAQVGTYRGGLSTSAQTLLACLLARDAVGERLLRVTRYASNRLAVEGSSPEAQALNVRAAGLNTRVNSALSFIASEIPAIPDDRFAAFLTAEPALADYRHHLQVLRSARAHMLTPETEKALATLGQALDAPRTIQLAITSADMRFPPIQDTDGETVAMSVARYGRLAASADREVRRRAHESLAAGYDRHKTALATALASHVNQSISMARLRGYGSALEAALHSSQVPVQVYETVLDTLFREVTPHVRRYARLRQRVLGLDRVMRYDMTAPLDHAYDATLSYADGIGLIKAGLTPLGSEYAAILDRAFAERWIDRADNEGKSHGAFNSGIYGWHPVIMMTWQDKARDTFTLAHELGHCCHRVLSMQNQNFTNSGLTNIGRFFLEAPSTANEALLGQYLLANTTDIRQRRYLIEAFLGTFMHNMVTHLLEAAFERRVFAAAEAGKPLTLSVLTGLQGEVMEALYGDAVGLTEGDLLTWESVPHFYVGFYPLVYAVGLSAGCAVAEAIAQEGEPAVGRWLQTLKAGSTLHPLELYRLAGVDMAKPEPIERGVAVFGRLVSELENCYE